MSTTTTTFVDGFAVIHTDTLLVCGGGARCTTTDRLTSEAMTSPHGALRCMPCAKRLGWTSRHSDCHLPKWFTAQGVCEHPAHDARS